MAWAEALRYSNLKGWIKYAGLLTKENMEQRDAKILEVARTETAAKFYIETRYEGDVIAALETWERIQSRKRGKEE